VDRTVGVIIVIGLNERVCNGGYTSGDDGKSGNLSKLSSKKRRKNVIWLQT
jgi:hypothetical protein